MREKRDWRDDEILQWEFTSAHIQFDRSKNYVSTESTVNILAI